MTIDNKSEQAVEDQTAIGAESDVSMDILQSIKDATDGSAPEEGPDGKSANAPAEGNPKDENPDAPVDGKPAEDEAEQSDESDPAPEGKEEGKDKEDDSLMNALLDVEPEEKMDLETYKKRYSDATRHITELNDKVRSIEEILAAAGRRIINTKNGPKLVATDDAPELKSDMVKIEDIFDSLTESEQTLFNDDPARAAKLIAEKVAKQIADSYAPVQASAKDVVLSSVEMDGVYKDFLDAKLPDGKTPRFQDADHPEVRDMMSKAYQANTPAMQKFRELASKDKDVHYLMLDYLYNKAFRARHAKLSLVAAQQKATEDTKKKIQREPSVSTKGAGQTVRGQQVRGGNAPDVQGKIFAAIESM